MIELVLGNNNFSVGSSTHYTQINDKAIGSKLGRNYAKTCVQKPFIYLRYIDDIFGIWLHGEDALRKFHSLTNGLHDQIKLELRF